jgi:hypothetical protein
MEKAVKVLWVPAISNSGAARHFALALCAGILLTSSAHADVVIEQQSENLYRARIEGGIAPGDYQTLVDKVAAIQASKPSPTIHYALNSGGGNFEAALNIGRFLRKKNALALVEEGDICTSSCVFILAGAAHREIKGIVGIQRPSESADTHISAEAQTTKDNKRASVGRAYLAEMNVQQKLYDDILNLPPEKVRVLSQESLTRYGLTQEAGSK